MNSSPDKRLDTICRALGFGIQIETTRTPGSRVSETKFYPANGIQLHVFSGSSTDDGVHSPAESASVWLTKEMTDELIAALQAHRLRMEPEQPAVSA